MSERDREALPSANINPDKIAEYFPEYAEATRQLNALTENFEEINKPEKRFKTAEEAQEWLLSFYHAIPWELNLNYEGDASSSFRLMLLKYGFQTESEYQTRGISFCDATGGRFVLSARSVSHTVNPQGAYPYTEQVDMSREYKTHDRSFLGKQLRRKEWYSVTYSKRIKDESLLAVDDEWTSVEEEMVVEGRPTYGNARLLEENYIEMVNAAKITAAQIFKKMAEENPSIFMDAYSDWHQRDCLKKALIPMELEPFAPRG